nr:enoyl-CoA hydratase-related protein [Bradyrhizobium diazoefficiens]
MAGVKQARDGAVGILTLDEPATLNAMTPDLLGALAAAIAGMTADEDIRALILTGAGRGFCSGQNLKASEALGEDIAAGVMRYYWPAFKALRECRVPVVVAVNGVAAGGGFSLAMAGDMIVAAKSASFIQVFSRIALVPDLGSTWLLPRLVGRQRALELMLLNEPLTAERAQRIGLVRQVVDDAKLMEEAVMLARRLAEGPTRALVATRALVEESEHATYEAQFRREIELQAVVRKGLDAIEGRNAFVEKRQGEVHGTLSRLRLLKLVMPGLDPGIHVLASALEERGWPGQARP